MITTNSLIALFCLLAAGILLFVLCGIYLDYKAHKKPLQQEDPKVKYTLPHHLLKVTIPLVRYRLTVVLDFANSRNIDKF